MDSGILKSTLFVLTALLPWISMDTSHTKGTINMDFKSYADQLTAKVAVQKATGIRRSGNHTNFDELDVVFEALDPSDTLLNITVEDYHQGVTEEYRRQAVVTGPFIIDPKRLRDPYKLIERILALMYLHLNQARNRLPIMQDFRNKYRHSGLYKTGFLYGKLDRMMKTWFDGVMKHLKSCMQSRMKLYPRFELPDAIEGMERYMHLFFDVQILMELLGRNDERARLTLMQYSEKRKQVFDAIFED